MARTGPGTATSVTLSTSDIEIGAIEIKNPTDDTRATVGSNGLHVDVRNIQAGDNNIGNVDIVTVPAPLSTTGGGTEATALRVTVASDSTGVLSVDDNGSALTVDNAGTFAVQVDGSALTSLQLLDDTVYTDGTGTPSKAFGIAGTDGTNPQIVKTDTSGELQVDVLTMPTTAVTQSGTWDEVGINDSGNNISVDWGGTVPPIGAGTEAAALRVTVATDSTGVLSIDDNGGIITVDGTVAVTNAGLTELAAAINASSQMDVNIAASAATLTVASHAVTNAGTFAVQDATAQASLSVMDDWDNTASDGASVSGDVAHDGVDAGEPVKVGHVAIAHGTNPTAVAAADRSNWYANRAGVPFVIGGHPNVKTASINVTDADGAQTDTAIITISTGLKIVVTHITVAADNANTGDVGFRIGFGTANTPAEDAAGLVLAHPGLDGGAGMILGNGGGIIGVGADNEDLRLTCEDPAGGSFTVNVGYYTIES